MVTEFETPMDRNQRQDEMRAQAARRAKVFDQADGCIAVGWRDEECILTVVNHDDVLDKIEAMEPDERPDTLCLCWRDDQLKVELFYVSDHGMWSERVRHIEGLKLLDCMIVDAAGGWVSIAGLMP